MAETANTKQDPSNMESNNKPQEVLTQEHIVRQRVPMKRDKPQKLKGYVSPFLADKAKIDAKFVHLQCVWRDLKKSRKLGKKAFKERDIDHKPRGKIKHKEDYMDPGVTINKSALTSDFKNRVGKLLRLERQVDENDNELVSKKVVEYRNVIHKDSQPVNSLLAIQQREVRTPRTKNVKRFDLRSSPIVEEISTARTVKPLKLSTRSLRGRSLSTSSEESLSPGPERKVFVRGQRTNTELNAGKVTLTQPNSPSKILAQNSQRSRPNLKTSYTIQLEKQDNSKENSVRRSDRERTDLVDSSKEVSMAQRELNQPSSSTSQENYREAKSRNQENKQHSLPPSTNQITSVRIQLDSSFSEDDYQLSPVDFPKERKISVRSISGSPKPTTKRDTEKQGREETPVSVLVESESDTDGIKPTHETVTIEYSKAKPVPKSPETRKISNDFNRKAKVFQNLQDVGRKSSQDFKSKRKVFETQEDKGDIRTKLQNIQSNIHKIVTDIKQSKEATGHVKPSDVSNHETTQSNSVDTDKAPFNVSPRAKQPRIFMEDKEKDKHLTAEKDMTTSAHKTSDSTLVVKGSERQGMSHIGAEKSDTVQVIDRVQTLKGNQNSEGKLSDQKETDKLTVMNNKDKKDLSDTCGDKQHHKYEKHTDKTKKKHSGHLVDVTVDNDNNERNETTHEIVPVKGGGHKRIVRHRSSKGKGQEPEEVATDLQKDLLTTKKVIERQLTGFVNERIETDNLVGALKRSMTKPTPREKVASATHEIHEIIQNGVIQEENGSKVYQVRVQMGPFTGDINYTQDGHTVIVEGSTIESPIFTKEIKVEFPTQGLDMELLSVHSEGSVVELNVPYLYVPSQSNGAVQHALDQYIYDEVSALKREYMQPWMNNDDPIAGAKVTENSLVMTPSSLTKYMTEEDMKQAEELEIQPGEETKDVIVTDLDSPRSHSNRLIPPLPKFAPPTPPRNGLDIDEEEKLLANSISGKRARRHRRNTSQSSNASFSSSDATTIHTNNNNNNNNNSNNSGMNSTPFVKQILQEQMPGAQCGSNVVSKNSLQVHRSRKYRRTGGRSNNEIGQSSHDVGSIVSNYPMANSQETMIETLNKSVSSKSRDACNIRDTLKLESNNPDEKDKLHLSQSGNSFKREKSFKRSGQRRSFKKKGSNNSKMAGERESRYSSDSLSEDSIFHNHSFSDSDSEHDQGCKHHENREKQFLSVPDIQVTEASSSGPE